jgi:hypothetical protein
MNRPSFLLGVLFAALAGTGAFVWISSVEDALGSDGAASVYVLGLVPILLLWAAPSWGRGAAAAGLAVALAVPTAVWWPTPLAAAITALTALSVARIAVIRHPVRLGAVGAELLMGALALGAAAFAYDGTSFGCAIAVWVACLLEVAGTAKDEAKNPCPGTVRTPFETAREQALRILEVEENRGSEGR